MESITAFHNKPEGISLIVRWGNPTPCELARYIRECVKTPGAATLSAHAGRDRLKQRGFTLDDIHRAFQHGYPYRMDPGAAPGEWKVNLAITMPNGRDAAVVCLVSPKSREVCVLTVMWIDSVCRRH